MKYPPENLGSGVWVSGEARSGIEKGSVGKNWKSIFQDLLPSGGQA
ncbi:MAG: hypothetical protein NTW84_07540 [Methanothrix sp.]|nr:hypothetical protein [Methanothrix sp.]